MISIWKVTVNSHVEQGEVFMLDCLWSSTCSESASRRNVVDLVFDTPDKSSGLLAPIKLKGTSLAVALTRRLRMILSSGRTLYQVIRTRGTGESNNERVAARKWKKNNEQMESRKCADKVHTVGGSDAGMALEILERRCAPP